MSKLLTVNETASELGRSADFVRDLVRRGRLVSMRINGRYYVPEWSIDELLRPKAEPVTSFPRQIRQKRGARAGQPAAASGHAGGERNAA